MKSYNLQYYVDKLKKGEKFSLARYGDGEFYCMQGRKGGNSNGCRYSPELKQALIDSMEHADDPTFIYGMQRVLDKDREWAEKEYPAIDWHDSEIFGEAVANGKLYPFIEQLRKMDIIIIGNSSIMPIVNILKAEGIIQIIPKNAFRIKSAVFQAIKNHELKHILPRVYLFSCGMAANTFISELHGKVDGWLIDVGHIWDPFVGNMSRCDLEGKTMEDINKNLLP